MSNSLDKSEQETIPCSVENLDADEVAYVRSLLQRLKLDHPVRMTAETLLEQRCVPKQSVPMLLLRLSYPSPYRWREQSVAAWILGRLTVSEEERGAIAQCLERLARRFLHRGYGGNSVYSGLIKIGTCIAWALLVLSQPNGLLPQHIGEALAKISSLSALLGTSALAPVLLMERERLAKIRASALTALAHIQPIKSISLLIDTLQSRVTGGQLTSSKTEAIVYAATVRALDEALSRMSAIEREALSATTVLSLVQILREMALPYLRDFQRAAIVPYIPLGLTILKILSETGATQVEQVEKMVKRVAKYSAVPSLRTAAAEVLPILQARLHTQETRKTLLRASDAGNISSDTLLRAASESANIDPNQLLRAQSTQTLPPPAE